MALSFLIGCVTLFQTYLDELKKIELLTPEAEMKLWHAYKVNGEEEARMEIIENYQPLVLREALRYKNGNLDVMDIIQEGIVGLMEAVERFEPERNIAFPLFAVHRIRGHILDFLRKEGRSDVTLAGDTEAELNWWETLPTDSVSPDVMMAEAEYSSMVKGTLQLLPRLEQKVLEQVCLEGISVKKVAETMDTSLSYVYRLQRNAVRRLRHFLEKTEKDWQD